MKISSRVKDLHLFIYFLFYFGRPRLEKKKKVAMGHSNVEYN